MSENIFEKNLEQYQEFQKNWMDNAIALTEQFDPAKYIEQMKEMQKNVVEGMNTLLSLKPEDVESDQLDKEEVLRIGKMRLFHYAPTVPARRQIKTPLLITYALVNRQYMMDLQPDRSVIKSFLDAGLDVYIIDWGYPTAEDMYLTLDDHINWYMDDCVDHIIEASGKRCVCSTLSDEEYLAKLDEKLNEELAEYQESKSMEELADLLEVIRAVAVARGSSMDEVEAVRRDKAVKRGGFEKKILLTEVTTDD